MITSKDLSSTTIVLGAGSSCEYGYPTGQELLNQIKELIPERVNYDIVDKKFLEHVSVTESDLMERHEKLLTSLNRSGCRSIDTYLQNPKNSENRFADLAKLIIYYLISKHEHKKNFEYFPKDDWISYFINRFISYNHESYLKFPPKIISFNYDNYFEERIRLHYKETYHLDIDISNKIHHVYGAISKQTEIDFSNSNKIDYDNYFTKVRKNKENLNIIRPHNESSFSNLLLKSKNLIFLGYGFDPFNNQLLFKNKKTFAEIKSKSKIYSTTIGISPPIIKDLKLQITTHGLDCFKLMQTIAKPPLFPEDI